MYYIIIREVFKKERKKERQRKKEERERERKKERKKTAVLCTIFLNKTFNANNILS